MINNRSPVVPVLALAFAQVSRADERLARWPEAHAIRPGHFSYPLQAQQNIAGKEDRPQKQLNVNKIRCFIHHDMLWLNAGERTFRERPNMTQAPDLEGPAAPPGQCAHSL